MGDLVDNASLIIEALARGYEQAARGKCAPETDPRFDGLHCVETHCEVELPAARVKMGRVRCVDCQSLKERGKL